MPFWKQVFARPGLVMATPPGTGSLPTQLRAGGASTIFFDLKLASRVGTPDAPADPATIVDVANREFDAAVKQTGCQTPLIAENELFGSGDADAVVARQRAVPRERARAPDPAHGARRTHVPADLVTALRR